jgi:hypothetical protein
MFFTEVENGIEIITETNQKILRDIINHHKPILFYMDSLIDSNLSPTVLSELIIFILKQNCIFQSEKDNIYWESSDIDTVYPNIFELFRQKNKS